MNEPSSAARFANRADDYARHRPTYPEAALDRVIAGLGPPEQLVAADVGAGTGISARGFADRGLLVHAIEPSAAMAAAAEPHPRVVWRATKAEATGLPSASVDVVVAAQAFHWFATPGAMREFHRVLRPTGRLALLWNKKNRRDPFTAAYRNAMFDLCGDAPAETFGLDLRVLTHGPFGAPAHVIVPHHQTLDLDGVIGRAMSGSYVPKSGPAHDEIVRRLRAVHAQFADRDGQVHLQLESHVWVAARG